MAAEGTSYWVEFLDAEVRQLRGRFRTRALILGEGPTLVLIHGTGGHLENYARNVRAFASHYRVVAIDLLWHGRSQTDAFDPRLFPAFVAQLGDVLDVLEVKQAHIEGQSLGGWVAARFAMAFPERVGKLILTTPMGYVPKGSTAISYGRMDRDALRASTLAVLEDPTLGNVRKRMERIVADPATVTDEAVAVRHALYNDPRLNAVQRLVTAAYFSDAVDPHALTPATLRTIAAPTLVYWGDENPTPPSMGLELSEALPQGTFHCAARTGHWAQYENAAEHNRVALGFLSG